ncbi:acyltransferase [Saccharopolyspora indica]|uniref:acyltransferase family protein n=1 Tax=Saccharopolyspora indica TaxID=1229659 RepID=UPI0022EB7580|nr:acyltransferase [Saccharopolyspora indica]MDA3647030.1 acyltransferase [Saccharopolyspora indica]
MHNGPVPAPSRGGRLPSLTALRAFAALLVFGHHFTGMQFSTEVGAEQRGASDEVLHVLFGTGVIGVSFFFVLSGFILTWCTPVDRSAGEFWLRRAAKVYPVFAVSTIGVVLLGGLLTGMWPSGSVVLSHVFLVQAWIPDQAYSLGLNPVTWSLSCEAFFYLTFPALLLVFGRARRTALWLTAAGCVVAAFALPGLVSEVFALREPAPQVMAPLMGYEDGFAYWFGYLFPAMRLVEFVLGIVLAKLVQRSPQLVPGLPVALVLLVAGFAINLALPPAMQPVAGMLIPFAVLIGAAAKADMTGAWSPLRSRVLNFFGEISFCFYAVHVAFFLFTVVYVPTPSGARDYPRLWLAQAGLIEDPTAALPAAANIALFAAYLAASALVAWLTHVGVEKPVMRLVHRRLAARRSAAAQQPVPDEADERTAIVG